MKYAVFGDVHGNEIALNVFLREVHGTVDGYICLGDIVGYGPDNDRCLEIIHDLNNIVIVRGNHEQMFLDGNLAHCSIIARMFYKKSSTFFSRRDLVEKINLAEAEVAGWLFCHTIKEADRWPYLYDAQKLTRPLTKNMCVGHTHYQKRTRANGYELINVGSIGQNREDKSNVCWGIFDAEVKDIVLCKKRYDVSSFARKLRQCDYAEELISYYEKRPEVETSIDTPYSR